MKTILVAFISVLAVARAATAATYVVDQGNPAAGDQNPGTEEKPLRTIQKGADIAKAGDTVCVMEGNYPERIKLSASGESSKWITFAAAPARQAAMQGFDTNKQSYIRIQGFEVTNDKFFYGKESDYEAGIQITGHDIEVTDNYVHDLGCGIHGVDANNVRVAYNHVYKCQFLLLIGGEHWVVENNDLDRVIQHRPNTDGDYSRGFGRHIVIRNNRFHGTRKFPAPGEVSEVPTAHLDCFQTWAQKPYHHLQDFLFEENMCEVFSQGTMVSRDKSMDPGAITGLVYRRNVYWHGGNFGLCLESIAGVTSEQNTFAKLGLYGSALRAGTEGNRINNFLVDVDPRRKPRWEDGSREVDMPDPQFVDKDAGNFRLKKGSPLIGAGAGGATIGALEYPNVYYVDPRHPGADDNGFGYPGWPYKTAAKALAVAQAGETVVLRGGVYREALKPAADGVALRAKKGEKVLVSGADRIEGWKRTEKGWEAPLAARPRKVLRDGTPFADFAYTDYSSKTAVNKIILLTSGEDPRLHAYETVVRAKPLDLGGCKDVKVEGIEVVSALAE